MSQQLVPYKMDEMLYLRSVEKWGMPNMPTYRRIQTQLGCIDTTTDVAELHVQLLLRGIAATISAASYHDRYSSLQPVGRIEIFGDSHTDDAQNDLQDQGLVLFDLNGRPLVHVFHALIGYSGSGPGLTEAIFREVGVDQGIFDQIQTTYDGIRSTNVPYYVVVQKVPDDPNRPGMTNWFWSSVAKSARS